MTFKDKLTALVADRASLSDSQVTARISELRADLRGLPADSLAMLNGYLGDFTRMLRTKTSEVLEAAIQVIEDERAQGAAKMGEDELFSQLGDVLAGLAAPGGWAAKRVATKGKRASGSGQKRGANEPAPGELGVPSGERQSTFTGDAKRTKRCPHCGGSGKAPSGVTCPGCGGSGVVSVFGIALLDAVSGQTDPGDPLAALQEIQKGARQ